jgi:hypothetical protein
MATCRSAASCSAVTWLIPLAADFFRSSQQARRRPTSPGPSAWACIACGGVQTLGVRYEPLRSCTSTAGARSPPRPPGYAIDASPSSMRKGHSRQEDVRVSSTAPLRSTDWLATYAWTIPRGDRMALRTGKHRAGTPPRQTLQHARWTGARVERSRPRSNATKIASACICLRHPAPSKRSCTVSLPSSAPSQCPAATPRICHGQEPTAGYPIPY